MKTHSDFMDPITDTILYNIDPEIHESMSPDQLLAVRNAIRNIQPRKNPLFNVQGFISLYFVRLYYHVLIGTDQRQASQTVESNRRGLMSSIKNILFLVFVTFCIVSFFVVIFYLFVFVLNPGSTIQHVPRSL